MEPVERVETWIAILASLALIAGVSVYISKNVDVTCWKIPYITSGCTISH